MSTIGIPFERHINRNGHQDCIYGFVPDCDGDWLIHASSYQSERKVRKQIKEKVIEALSEHKQATENQLRWVIGCQDGTVLLVEFRNNTWGYSIFGKGRKTASGCHGHKDYQGAIQGARIHAEDGYGGISWEHGG